METFGIIGAMSEAGQQAIAQLQRKNAPLHLARLFETPERFEEKQRLRVPHRFIPVEKFDPKVLPTLQVAIFCTTGEFYREHLHAARDVGCEVYYATQNGVNLETISRLQALAQSA